MYVWGGYVMTRDNAKAWAKRHYGDAVVFDDSRSVASSIEKYHTDRGGTCPCWTVFIRPHEPRVMILTHVVDDPKATSWWHHKEIPETDSAKRLRDLIFTHELDKGIYEFVTVCDPCLKFSPGLRG